MTAIPPRWGFRRISYRFPRALPWAITLWAFGPESQNSNIAING